MNLDHINIRANAVTMEKLKGFYCDVLGLEVGDRPNVSRPGYWLCSGGQALVHLQLCEEALQMHNDMYLDHVAFSAESLDSLIARLKVHDIDYYERSVEGFNMTQLFFSDPVGNRVEVNCKTIANVGN